MPDLKPGDNRRQSFRGARKREPGISRGKLNQQLLDSGSSAAHWSGMTEYKESNDV
jgi:hypothetical protein